VDEVDGGEEDAKNGADRRSGESANQNDEEAAQDKDADTIALAGQQRGQGKDDGGGREEKHTVKRARSCRARDNRPDRCARRKDRSPYTADGPASRPGSRRPEGGEEREAGQRVQASQDPGECTAQVENEYRGNDKDHGVKGAECEGHEALATGAPRTK